MNFKFTNLFYLLTLVLFIASCSSDDSPKTPEVTIEKSDVIENYATIVFASYQEALADAEDLEVAINAFTTTPTDANFTAAKDAWLVSRESYGQTEAFRFANGPIDIDDDAPEGLINSWPLDENYIDYVEGNEDSGLINDATTFPTITKVTLVEGNQPGTEEASVSIGYHAIEFLLWGQDTTDPSEILAGQRPYTDFVDGGTASNQDRRREYLDVCADLLTDHLQLMIDEWEIGGAYRTTILAEDENTVLVNIITAIATLSKSELAGERMFVAYDNQDQEDEHSCFSDNTHRDIRLNLAGIANVYRGSYGTISGDSLEDLIIEIDAALGAEVSAQLAVAEAAVDATATPFDFAITDTAERVKVLAAVNALQDLGDKFVEGGAALGLSITAE
ncbi:MAG: imelysin family protein [Algibacter sp.]